MKKIIGLALLAVFTMAMVKTFAQADTIFAHRKSAVKNLEVFRSTITDSTLDMMKGLLQMQQSVLTADKLIIEGYLDSLKTKADSLEQKVKSFAGENEKLSIDINSKHDLFLYGAIGGGVIFLLFVLFLILYFIASSGKKKLKKQVDNIEKIKQENLAEIEVAKNEIAKAKANAEQEIAVARKQIDNELKKVLTKIDWQTSENARLEKRIAEKTDENTALQVDITMLQGNLEKKQEKLMKSEMIL